MPLTVTWEKLNVDREAGSPLILKRGETLPDWVSDFIRSTLVMIGAVRDFGSPVQAAADRAEAEMNPVVPAEPVRPAEVPPTGPVTAAPVADVEKPAVSDNKDAWEAYAVYRDYTTQTEAESMTKAKLVALVNDRERV